MKRAPLVVSIAQSSRDQGLVLLDLVQERNLGLMRSVDTFDRAKGLEFSVYAVERIRDAIASAIADQARTIRIPVHMIETVNNVEWARRELREDLGRQPTVEDVANRADLPTERVLEILRINPDAGGPSNPL